MSKMNMNELIALHMVLEFIDTKDLLTAAMHHFADSKNAHDTDNADICYKAITSFLS